MSILLALFTFIAISARFKANAWIQKAADESAERLSFRQDRGIPRDAHEPPVQDNIQTWQGEILTYNMSCSMLGKAGVTQQNVNKWW